MTKSKTYKNIGAYRALKNQKPCRIVETDKKEAAKACMEFEETWNVINVEDIDHPDVENFRALAAEMENYYGEQDSWLLLEWVRENLDFDYPYIVSTDDGELSVMYFVYTESQ